MTSPYRPDERWGDYGQYGQSWAAEQPRQPEPPPREPPRRRPGRPLVLVAAAFLLVATAGVVLLTSGDDHVTGTGTAATTRARTTDAVPGDCVKVTVAGATDAEVAKVDCAAPDAIYRVAVRAETDSAACPGEQYVSYTEEGRLRLCLQLNVRAGDCIEVTERGDRRTDCAAGAATHRVLDVLDGVADPARCAAGATDVLAYPTPPRTICLVAPAS